MYTTKELLEKTYADGNAVPWDNLEPPQELVWLIDSGHVEPGTVLDLGCGNGHYSIYLAKKGFTVTGIDISKNAIDHAKKNATDANVQITFIEIDARDISNVPGTFDFIFEWGLLHFILPQFRGKYVQDISQKIKLGGLYIVLTFNEQSPEWGGGKYRNGISGAPLYYSSMEELIELYTPYFEILETKIRPTFFKNSGNEHLENYLLLRKK
jgi:2-polyprenyl-3-methyl-5-hydroxy-6-metoxy-1,4-benzoquinol methylase